MEPFWNKEGDSVEYWTGGEAYFGEAIDGTLTIYRSQDDPSRIVGVEVGRIHSAITAAAASCMERYYAEWLGEGLMNWEESLAEACPGVGIL